jgi:hypothetical protein
VGGVDFGRKGCGGGLHYGGRGRDCREREPVTAC